MVNSGSEAIEFAQWPLRGSVRFVVRPPLSSQLPGGLELLGAMPLAKPVVTVWAPDLVEGVSVIDQIGVVTRILAALGIRRDSPLLGGESWIAWATMVVSGTAGLFLGRIRLTDSV